MKKAHDVQEGKLYEELVAELKYEFNKIDIEQEESEMTIAGIHQEWP